MALIQALALAASFVAGAFFVLFSLRRRRPEREEAAPPASEAVRDIYWPLLLGTGERTFDAATRLAIIRELAAASGHYRVPILLCAREQERDADMLRAIERALATTGVPPNATRT